jgi:hypothetical protein
MAEDLTPKILGASDSAVFEPGGGARMTTVVRFMLGKLGPFEHTFDRAPQRHEIDAAIAERRRALEGLV